MYAVFSPFIFCAYPRRLWVISRFALQPYFSA
jgi:hypothetical protein